MTALSIVNITELRANDKPFCHSVAFSCARMARILPAASAESCEDPLMAAEEPSVGLSGVSAEF